MRMVRKMMPGLMSVHRFATTGLPIGEICPVDGGGREGGSSHSVRSTVARHWSCSAIEIDRRCPAFDPEMGGGGGARKRRSQR
jgi:hypothetical protein